MGWGSHQRGDQCEPGLTGGGPRPVPKIGGVDMDRELGSILRTDEPVRDRFRDSQLGGPGAVMGPGRLGRQTQGDVSGSRQRLAPKEVISR